MKITTQLGRFSLFIIYFWFGVLKVFGISPAETLVQNLFNETLGTVINFNIFCLSFGLFECILGILWLFPKLTKSALYITLFHMFSTFLPVLVLTEEIWQTWFTPTLVGQYIIKNLALISLALFISKSYEQKQSETDEKTSHFLKVERIPKSFTS
jgi:uncharacterized membrane protein YkgB